MSSAKATVLPLRSPATSSSAADWRNSLPGDLLSHITPGASVLVVDSGRAIAEELSATGCNVTRIDLQAGEVGSPGGIDLAAALRKADPDVVLLIEGWVVGLTPGEILRRIVQHVPRAEVGLVFWNAASATLLIGALTGRPMRAALHEGAVQSALAQNGYALQHRWEQKAVAPARALARDADTALRALFQQLEPGSAVDEVVYWARRSAAAVTLEKRPDLEPGLLSVIIRNHSLERLKYLDHAIFSLACQSYQPLEIVISTQCTDPDTFVEVERILERHRPIGGYRYQIVSEPSEQDIRARLLNRGIDAARGQYVAFLDDDDVVYPRHYTRLIEALQNGEAAWAFGRTRRSVFFTDARGDLYCRFKDEPYTAPYSRLRLIQENFIPCHAYVLDRFRLGRFPVRFAEEVTRNEDYVFLLRLGGLFQPIQLDGPFGCEYRMREDGSNSTVVGKEPLAVRRRKEQEWMLSRAAKEAIKRQTVVLMPEDEFESEHLDALPPPPVPSLRHLIAERVNDAVKRVAPKGHRALKRSASWLLRFR